MSEPDKPNKLDQLAREALLQATPKRTAFDEAILAAARDQAVVNRQTNGAAAVNKNRSNQLIDESPLKWWRRPIWLGAGSTVAVLATTLMLTSQQPPLTSSDSEGREVASAPSVQSSKEIISSPKNTSPEVGTASSVPSTAESVAVAITGTAPSAAPAPVQPSVPTAPPQRETVIVDKSSERKRTSAIAERREQAVEIADSFTRAPAQATTQFKTPPRSDNSPANEAPKASALAQSEQQTSGAIQSRAVSSKPAADAAEASPAQCRKLLLQVAVEGRNLENPTWVKIASDCGKRFPNELWEMHLGPVGDFKSK
jgi:hypothetical protein